KIPFMLRDQIAVITGSTSGIGLGLAEAFAAAGCRVVVNGIVAGNEAEELVRRLQLQHQTEVIYHPANLADPEHCAALIRDAEAHFGAIDILINNAGIQHVAPVEQFPVDRWNSILAINLSAAFHTIRVALPGMQRRNRGRILNIASVHGLVASVHKGAYVAAKHGIVGLTKVVALENIAHGITCNAICPGYVLAPLVQKQIDGSAVSDGISKEEANRKLLEGKQPSGRFISVEDIA